jgi:hypothetical protein
VNHERDAFPRQRLERALTGSVPLSETNPRRQWKVSWSWA